MRPELLALLRAPRTLEPLDLHPFSPPDPSGRVLEGVLVSRPSRRAFPVVEGVPVLLDRPFTKAFLATHAAAIARLQAEGGPIQLGEPDEEEWSFSAQWEDQACLSLETTWGWTLEDRTKMFFPEMLVDPEWCRGKRFLDAGSGNGRLTESVAQFGGMVVGVDYSTSVYAAERRRARPGVHFVRGDLQTPPFAPGTFDLIFSNGVLHHTPSTRATFRAVAALASPAGRFYVWLYKSIPESRRADVIRFVVSRLPPRLQHAFVVSWVSARTMLSVVKRGGYRLQPLAERRLHIYDLYTPRWRHYHTPIEVAEWYHDCGFGPPTLTHWNSPCGFGMVAQKGIFEDTPGPHFGQRPRAPAWLMRSEERRAR